MEEWGKTGSNYTSKIISNMPQRLVLNHNLNTIQLELSAELLRYNNNIRIKEDEIRDAIKSLSNNKAAGIDRIPAEFYKANPKESAPALLHPQIKDAWENESFPSESTPKKANRPDCDNWRGICVLPVVAKIISKMTLEPLKQHLYSTIDAEQARFRPG